MIFVTVGTQVPFNRLVRAVDAWAGRTKQRDLFAQIGPTEWRPENMEWATFIDAETFARKAQEARVLVSHAGMGTILTALNLGKPIVIMPRRAHLKEHRNDHQMDTAEKIESHGLVRVAFDEEELFECLDTLDDLIAPAAIGPYASQELLETLKEFINR